MLVELFSKKFIFGTPLSLISLYFPLSLSGFYHVPILPKPPPPLLVHASSRTCILFSVPFLHSPLSSPSLSRLSYLSILVLPLSMSGYFHVPICTKTTPILVHASSRTCIFISSLSGYQHVPKSNKIQPKLVHALHISENCCIFAQNF